MKITKSEYSDTYLLKLRPKDFDSSGIVKQFALLGCIGEFFAKQILAGLEKQADVQRGLVVEKIRADLLPFNKQTVKEMYLKVDIRRSEYLTYNVSIEARHKFEDYFGTVSLVYANDHALAIR